MVASEHLIYLHHFVLRYSSRIHIAIKYNGFVYDKMEHFTILYTSYLKIYRTRFKSTRSNNK